MAYCYAQQTEVQYLSGTGKDQTVDWRFMCTDGARSGAWATIPVPSCWELQGFGAYNYGHDRNPNHEQGIYETEFTLPSSWKGRRIFIVFEGVMTDAEVRVNGQLAGTHQGAFYRFKFDISQLVNYKQSNTLRVTVDKESSNRSINEAERRADYWIFGGIFRPVYLEAQPQQFIDHVAIDARHTGDLRANVIIDAAKRKANAAYTVSLDVIDAEGHIVSSSAPRALEGDSTMLSMQLQGVRPWTAETPNLYTARFTLRQGKRTLHTYNQHFGFRTIELRERDGFYVNGVKVKFKGVCRHTFWPESGRTSSPALALEDVNLIKDMNMNAVRMSHYPPDQYFLDICDSLGLYVIDELAGWQSRYEGDVARRLVRSMIQRDVNHPCIVIWANGNEGGFPPESRPLYPLLDIQKRQVVEPWSRYNGVDTHHYPKYGPTVEKPAKGDVVYMPTESLHGLHDGGHGAGLEDYWEVIRNAPTAAGQFLWNLADEGVVRRDIHDSIDVFNDKAPDGILGPHHEREGSFYTIKEVWCPVYVEAPDFATFDGNLSISNRYHFTNLRDCRFSASLISYPAPLDSTSRSVRTFEVASPDVAPWTEGATLQLNLPRGWRRSDLLTLTAIDPTGRELNTWTWRITPVEQIARRLAHGGGSGDAKVEEADTLLTVRANGGLAVTFSKRSGYITRIACDGKSVPLTRGPRFVGVQPRFVKLSHQSTAEGYQVVAAYADGQQLQWTFEADGWLRLDYGYAINGDFDFAGITFDYPEGDVLGARLLADGPYRVWKNRLKGVDFGLYEKPYNNTITGQTWDYPEFKGYYAHFAAVTLQTRGLPVTILSATDDVYLHLFTPERPKHMSRNVESPFPDGQLSLLNCIPGVGTKFSRADQEGPQGQKSHYENGFFRGRAYFRFGK